MASEDQTPHSNGGSRNVSNYELKLLSQEINYKLEAIAVTIGSMGTTQATQAVQIASNHDEIEKLRQHFHDINGEITPLKVSAQIFTPAVQREVMDLVPFVETLKRELDEEKVKILAAEANRKRRRQTRWFGLPDQIVAGLVALAGLIFATHIDAIWHALFH